MSSFSRPPYLLYLAFALGIVAVGLAVLGFWKAEGEIELVEQGYAAVSLLLMNAPRETPSNVWLVVARVSAMFFWLTTVLGLIAELSPDFRTRLRRVWFWWLRKSGRPSAVVIGLGWVGGVLAAEVRRRGRPVYALALDVEGTRAQLAHRAGVLVEEGDATTAEGLSALPLATTEEVFIATGDDVRNIEVAGSILEGVRGRKRTVYVHIGDPSISVHVGQRGVLPGDDGRGTSYRPFSVLDNAARDLATDLHRTLAPSRNQTLHVVLVGFGALGQTIALRLARSMHFANGRRLRLTVLHSSSEAFAVERFRALHPGFAPGGDFSLERFSEYGPHADHWGYAPESVRPASEAWRTRSMPTWTHAIEFAVLAEFLQCDTPVSPETVALLRDRFRTDALPEVRPAIVIATNQEHVNARYAVGIRDALAAERGWPPTRDPITGKKDLSPPEDPDDGLALVVPIYPHLFDETGLTTLVRQMQSVRLENALADESTWVKYHLNKVLPIKPFGLRRSTASYEVVTNKARRADAEQLHATYQILQGESPGRPMASMFELSNIDAAALAVRTLDRYFFSSDRWLSSAEAEAKGVYHPPILTIPKVPLFIRFGEVGKAYPAFKSEVRPYDLLRPFRGMQRDDAVECCKALPEEWLDRLDPRVCPLPSTSESPERIQHRKDVLEGLATWVQECLEHFDLRRNALVDEDSEAVRMVIERFNREVEQCVSEGQPRIDEEERVARKLVDRLAAMEHNRWMAERLVFGWRAGSRSEAGRRRPTFLQWSLLDEDQQLYDRAHLPRIILGRQADLGQIEVGTLYYLRESALRVPEAMPSQSPRNRDYRSNHLSV